MADYNKLKEINAELLEACKALLELTRGDDRYIFIPVGQDAVIKAEAAITKATQETEDGR